MNGSILDSHLEMLRVGSGISDEVIAERGYRSISASQGKEYGFAPSQCRSGLLIPVWSPDGVNSLPVLRPDNPRLGSNGKPRKYEMPKGQVVRLDCPPRCRLGLADPKITLWVTEGPKKADAMASRGLCAIDMLGVWSFKANSEPLDYGQWPCNQRQLLDDLWALALANLSSMPDHEAAVNTDAPLFGRTLEPWRAVLAVAHWLDGLGEESLYSRMVELAKAYQTERAELEPVDLTRLVLRALFDLASKPALPTLPATLGGVLEFKTADVTAKVNELAIEEEVNEGDLPYTKSMRVGRVLKSLRLRQPARSSGETQRKWRITSDELDGLARSYGLSETPPSRSAGCTGFDGLLAMDEVAAARGERL